MGGDFQKSLQLFSAYGYCVFEDNVSVDPSGVLDGRPNYADIIFSELFVGSCVDRPEVMDEGPDYATALLSEFCTRARFLIGLWQPRCKAERKGDFKQDGVDSSVSLIFPSSSSSFFHLLFFFFLF